MGSAASLEEIGYAAGTDKSKREHNYLDFYEKAFTQMREKKFVLIETGILFGQSLKTWSEYFRNATVVGLDIKDHGLRVDLPDNAYRRYGDGSRLEFLDGVIAEFASRRIG